MSVSVSVKITDYQEIYNAVKHDSHCPVTKDGLPHDTDAKLGGHEFQGIHCVCAQKGDTILSRSIFYPHNLGEITEGGGEKEAPGQECGQST